jgi:hypothetical protein
LLAAAAAVAVPAMGFAAENAAAGAGKRSDLAPPVQLTADGKAVDVGEIGHAAPFFADFDGDGKRDLLAGNFGNQGQGKLLVFKNQGTDAEPKFGKYEYLKVGADLGTVPVS